MNKLFRILAPSSALSVVIHIVLWISMIWLANIGFAYMTVDSLDYSLSTNGIKATGFQPVRFSVMYYNLPSHF